MNNPYRSTSDNERSVRLCALGEAAWQALAHRELDLPWSQKRSLAWGPAGAGHRFLFAAVTVDPRPALPRGLLGPVCDSHGALSASDLPGTGWSRISGVGPWMMRPSTSVLESHRVPGLRIVEVRSNSEMVIFERTAFLAAGGGPPDHPGELHPAASWQARYLHAFVAWLGGVPCGTALAVEHDEGLLVSAVAVLPEVRRCGIGKALTIAGLATAPRRLATLSASSQGISMYRKLGFQEVGLPVHWAQK